jgi:hypothetical protein
MNTQDGRWDFLRASDLASQVSPSGSGITTSGSDPFPTAGPGRFDRAFRQEVADRVLGILTAGYVARREFVREEARKRNLSVEQLMAAYIARMIMDKVDKEYI